MMRNERGGALSVLSTRMIMMFMFIMVMIIINHQHCKPEQQEMKVGGWSVLSTRVRQGKILNMVIENVEFPVMRVWKF